MPDSPVLSTAEIDEGPGNSFVRSAPSSMPPFYYVFAHLAFAAAWLLVVLEPHVYVGFFYHSRMMAPVHLITLGWISSSILGSLYLIAPMALRSRMVETRLDRFGFWMYAIGVIGMVSHFWLDSLGGMIWSALLVLVAFLIVGFRCAAMLKRARVSLGVKAHISFAFCNVLVAAVAGMVLALSKLGTIPALPGTPLGRVAAHAHLAAFGWATMMFCGVAYRLLPMVLPAAVPRSSWIVLNAMLFEAGVLCVFFAFFLGGEIQVGAVLMAISLSAFAAVLVWMLFNRRPPGAGIPRSPTAQIGLALVYLAVAVTLALVLTFADLDESLRLRLIPVYGVVLLVGFLAQVINGVSLRIVPLYRWFRQASTSSSQPGHPYVEQSRITAVALAGWILGLPLVAFGLFLEHSVMLGVGSWMMLLTVLAGFATVRYE